MRSPDVPRSLSSPLPCLYASRHKPGSKALTAIQKSACNVYASETCGRATSVRGSTLSMYYSLGMKGEGETTRIPPLLQLVYPEVQVQVQVLHIGEGPGSLQRIYG